jgi:hypothetical protein
VSPLAGVWRRTNGDSSRGLREYVVFWPNGCVESLEVDTRAHALEDREPIAIAGALPRERNGTFALDADGAANFGSIGFHVTTGNLRLEFARWKSGGPATLVLERCDFPELAMTETPQADGNDDDGDEIVELCDDNMPPARTAAFHRRGRTDLH